MTIYNKKFVVVLLIILAFAAIGISIFVSRTNASAAKDNNVNMHLDLRENFTSIKSLHDSAQLIAKVKIEGSTSYEYGNVIFTLSKADIKKVYKGDLDKNSVINILETGGTGNDGLEYLSDGNTVFAPGDEAVVYLEKYIGPVAEDSYVIKGVYQGKFKVKGDRLLPASETEGELKNVGTIHGLGLE
jgi:Na+-transporting methylmalonyl-CoA/oxaloacetate decarboxylase gamma subunit